MADSVLNDGPQDAPQSESLTATAANDLTNGDLPMPAQTMQDIQEPSQPTEISAVNGYHNSAEQSQAFLPAQSSTSTLLNNATSTLPTNVPQPIGSSTQSQEPVVPTPQATQTQASLQSTTTAAPTPSMPPRGSPAPKADQRSDSELPPSVVIPPKLPHGSPTRQYINNKVTPWLLEGMKWIALNEPEKPLKWLGEYLLRMSKQIEGE